MTKIKPNIPKSRPTVLTKDTGWYGGHSGYYEQMGRLLQHPPSQASIIKPKKTLICKVIGRLNSIRFGRPWQNDYVSSAQLKFYLRTVFLKGEFSCILNMDDHWPLLKYWKTVPRSLVGVIHIPISQWVTDDNIPVSRWVVNDGFEMCRKLQSAVVLWEREIHTFEQYVGVGRVAFVPHGIDTKFFHTGAEARGKKSFLSCGQYLRDFQMLKSVFFGIQASHSDSELKIVIPARFRKNIDLSWADCNPNVSILSGLSDEELRSEYQRAAALLIPFIDSGANNSIMEAMACGCPIVTNDVGGIRSYGGGSIYPVGTGASELVAIALKLIEEPAWAIEMSHKLRSYSLNFDWERIFPLFYSTIRQLTKE